MKDKDKIDQILDLISEKSGIIQDEITRLTADQRLDPDSKDLLIAINAEQVTTLDTLYNEVVIIKNSEA